MISKLLGFVTIVMMLPGNEVHNNIRPPTLATLCVHALINAIIVSFVIRR